MAGLSPGVQIVWQLAASEAAQAGHALIEPAHLFVGLCSLGKVLQPKGEFCDGRGEVAPPEPSKANPPVRTPHRVT